MRAAASLRLAVGTLCASAALAHAAVTPIPGRADPRIRTVAYNPDDVVELTGNMGYVINVEFAPGEVVDSSNGGQIEALEVQSRDNRVVIKPIRMPATGGSLNTDLTIVTNRRTYLFDYTASNRMGKPPAALRMGWLRFTYPQEDAKAEQAAIERARADGRLAAQPALARNTDYWFCGSPSLKPESAWDDGAQTHLRFAPGTEFPALFSQGEDGAESLVNFNVDPTTAEVVIHRTASRFIMRRGGSVGCVVNKGPGNAIRVPGHAITPGVERTTRSEP